MVIPDEIKTWLRENDLSREWLATQIGSTKGTLDQWFSKGFPDWAVLSIHRVIYPVEDDTAGLDVSFTHSEWMLIQDAMRLAGYSEHHKFYHDVIIDGSKVIVTKEKAKLVGTTAMTEEPKPYGSKKSA